MRLWPHGALVDQDSERHGLSHWLVCQKHGGCCSVAFLTARSNVFFVFETWIIVGWYVIGKKEAAPVPNLCSRELNTSDVAALCDGVLSLPLEGYECVVNF